MRKLTNKIMPLFLAGSVCCTVIGAVYAQQATQNATEDKTVAIVNGYEIKTSEVAMATDDIIGQLPDLPPEVRYPFVVDFLVERHLLAQLAVKESIADTEQYKRRLAVYQAKALRDAYFFQKIKPSVTDADVKAAYDKEAAKAAEIERVRARHILVKTEAEAKTVLARLKKNEKFEDIARQVSIDGSKDYGGDLGYFTAPEMVPEFSKAAFALKKDQISEPIKTDFGWHIIKLEDRKMGAAQPFEEVKGAVRNLLLRERIQAIMASMKTTSKIELIDEDLKKFAAEQLARQQQEGQKSESPPNPSSGKTSAPADNGKGDLAVPPQP